jgi:hypothetical protein
MNTKLQEYKDNKHSMWLTKITVVVGDESAHKIEHNI